MDAFLFDTTVLSIYLNPTHPHHVEKGQSLAALPVDSPRFISAIALAELGFGTKLAAAIGKSNLPTLEAMTCHETFIQQQLESLPFVIRRSARGEQQARGGAGRGCAAASLLR